MGLLDQIDLHPTDVEVGKSENKWVGSPWNWLRNSNSTL